MPNSDSPQQAKQPDRTPLEEIAKRTAESGAGLEAAAMAVGLEDHRRMLRDHASRLRDGNKAMAKAAGFEADEMDDDMGDIIVTGDINLANGQRLPWEKGQQPSYPPNPYPAQPYPSQPYPTPPTVPPAGTSGKTLSDLTKAAIVAAAATLGGVGTYLATRPAPAPAEQEQRDYQLHLLPPDKPASQ